MRWNDWALLCIVIGLFFVGTRHRRWIRIGALTLVAGIFWGAVIAGLAKWAFDLSGDHAFMFVGIPAALLVGTLFLYFAPRELKDG